jgi:fructokinase
MYDITAIGELLIDFTFKSADPMGYPTMEAHPGGAIPNLLAAVAKFGGTCAQLGKVGDDTFGRLLLRTLAEAGIDISGMHIDPTVFTTLAFVTLDESGDRSFSFARKPGSDTMITFEELKLSLIDEAKIFHFGTLSLTDEPSRTATQKAIAYAKARGKLISLDPDLRLPLWASAEAAKEQMLWALRQADVVKISDNEVEFLFGLSPEEGAKHLLKEYGCKLVFVTCGPEGAVYANTQAMGHVAGLTDVKVVDTTGAGDIFGGSALSRLLELDKAIAELTEEDLAYIARFATTAASLSTEFAGGIPSIQSKEAVLERMQSL